MSPIDRPRSVSEALKRIRQLRAPTLPPGREWVYFLEAETSPVLVRIAYSPDLGWRLVTAQSMAPCALKLVGLVSAPRGTGRALQRYFKKSRTHAHWYMLTKELAIFLHNLPKAAPMPQHWVDKVLSATGRKPAQLKERAGESGPRLGETTFDVYRAVMT